MFRIIVNRKTILKFYTMKKVNLFYLLSAILFGAMLVFASCTKEGAPGTDGQDGADGEELFSINNLDESKLERLEKLLSDYPEFRK